MLSISPIKKILNYTLITSLLMLSQGAVASPLDRILAVVNEDVILASDFTDNLKRASSQIRQQGAQIPTQQVLQSQVMEQMILRSIMLQMAAEQGIKVTDRQLNATISQIAQNNGMSLAKFREALIAQGQDYIVTREKIKEDILIKQVQESNINQRILISDREVQNFLSSKAGASNAEVLLSDILITIASPMTPKNIKSAKTKADAIYQKLVAGAKFSNMAISNSSASNALNGGDMGWRKVAALPSSLVSAISSLKIDQFSEPTRTPSGFHILLLRDSRNATAALNIQKTKVRHILISPSEIISAAQAKRTAAQLYQRLLKHHDDFAALAEEFSNDPGSSSQGGDLGWTENGQMVPEFEQVMNNSKEGQISLPFESRFGWHILEVVQRKTVDVSNLAKENQARNIIGKRKFAEEKANWLREIRTNAFVEFK